MLRMDHPKSRWDEEQGSNVGVGHFLRGFLECLILLQCQKFENLCPTLDFRTLARLAVEIPM